MEQRYKIDRGDWVALNYSELGTLAAIGKVIHADSDGVSVCFTFDGGPKELRFDGSAGLAKLSRIRWRRQGGRSRWFVP